jgi:hypothetical protein
MGLIFTSTHMADPSAVRNRNLKRLTFPSYLPLKSQSPESKSSGKTYLNDGWPSKVLLGTPNSSAIRWLA